MATVVPNDSMLKRATKLRLSIVICLVLTGPRVFADEANGYKESPFYKALHPNASSDTQIVSVRMGDAIYDIPRNYLAGVTQPSATNPYAAFTIMVLLPDLLPRTPENAARFDDVGLHDQFRALFEFGRHPKSSEDILEFYLRMAKMTKADYIAYGQNYKLYESLDNVPHEIYTKETENGLFFFTCDNENMSPFPKHAACTVNETFEKDIGVIYYFSREYRDQASDIELKLHRLLGSFLRK